jgi:hypothetical protein
MKMSRNRRSRDVARRIGRGAILVAVFAGAPFGCTREFYREWANQDVSEAVFEKSRDPRWRIDLFSVEPPMLSRFADPYDQDVPPAPPDDPAAEALSPVPQWPDNRLVLPSEGTGYIDLLEYWRRDMAAKAAAAGRPFPADEPEFWQRPDNGRHKVTDPRQPGMSGQPIESPAGPAVPPEVGSPFTPPPSLPPSGGTPAQPRPGGAPGAAMPGGASAPPEPRQPAPPAISPGATTTPPGAGAMRARPEPGANASTTGLVVRMQDPGPFEQVQAVDRRGGERRMPPKAVPNANYGTNGSNSTPISVRTVVDPRAKRPIPPPRSGATFAKTPLGDVKTLPDRSVSTASFQEDALLAEPPAGASSAMRTQVLELLKPVVAPPRLAARGTQAPRADGGQGQPGPVPGQPAPIPGQPAPGQRPPAASPSNILDRELVDQPQPLNPAQVGEVGRMTPQEAGELAKVLVPEIYLQSDTEGYGYPKGSRVYKISMQQAWVLALMNARFYQFNLENVYLAALPVTLQRFSFEPQFYAGLGQVTPVPQTQGAGPGASFPPTPGVVAGSGVNFNYATRYGPNGQISALNLGTVAGFGKLFSSGGQLLMGFANEVAFNFLNKNPAQPTVISALPISFVQPLLRNGGRAVVLEPLTQAERNLLYAVRTFALFRQQFFVVTMTGGQIQNFGAGFNLQGFSAPGNTDPTVGFLPVVFNLVEVEVDRRNLFFLESLAKLYSELIQGEASGLSRLQVDQVMQSLISGRQSLFNDKITYRTQLDQFRMQLSLPPDTPIIIDMSLAQPFYDVFDAVDKWQRRPDRDLDELPGIIARIPELEDIDVEGRSVLEPYRNYKSTLTEFRPENEEGLEDLLEAAVRIALEYRMDLMNNRAQLYDFWRQIRVTANALKGILNLNLSNNVYTPVTSSNPFAFLSQAKQFSLTLNAELPLVRVAERNAFRTALINYQRTRRSLQTAEDNLKIQLRNDLRAVHVAYINYEISKRNYELSVRLKDQAFEQIVAPPAGGTQALAQSANAATQTNNLLNFQGRLITSMLSLTNGWQQYQTNRLIVYRDIGILPYDEWEAFSELFPSQYHGPIIGQAPAGGTGFTPPAEASAETPERR